MSTKNPQLFDRVPIF